MLLGEGSVLLGGRIGVGVAHGLSRCVALLLLPMVCWGCMVVGVADVWASGAA
jgi:hypothetical protein